MSHRIKDRSKIEARRKKKASSRTSEDFRRREADRFPSSLAPSSPCLGEYDPLPLLDGEFNPARPIIFSVGLLERETEEDGSVEIKLASQDYDKARAFYDDLEREGEAVILQDWPWGTYWTDGLKPCPFCNAGAFISNNTGYVLADHTEDCPLFSDISGEGDAPEDMYNEVMELSEGWNNRRISEGPVKACPFCGVRCRVSEDGPDVFIIEPDGGRHKDQCPFSLQLDYSGLNCYRSEEDALKHWNERPGL